jgi:PAP2 superfamily
MSATTTAQNSGSGSEPESSSRRRFTGLFPNRLLRHRPPRLWQEALLIALGYFLYGRVRNLVPEHVSPAMRHGRAVQHLQQDLHLNFELTVNQFVATHEWLAQVMDYYYATLHFVVTPACLLWLFLAHSRVYRGARTVLFVTSLLALAGFWLYPLAPPRLLPQYGYIDTLLKFHTWGSLADPKIAQHSNQFAAMPSLHIGWALWCGAAIFFCARRLWVRLLGALYPLGTLAVIVGTANHFFIDAVAGLVVFLGGVGAQYLMSGRGAFHEATDRPDEITPVYSA